MKFGGIDHIILFGGARLLAGFSRRLKENRWRFTVFSSERHLNEAVDMKGKTLKQHLSDLGAAYFCSNDINSDPRLASHVTPATLGLAMGASWLFEKPLAAKLRGRLLDFMGIRLPQYRGGAHYTWQILSGDQKGACHLQVIRGGRKTFHRGPVIRSLEYAFPSSCRIPLDYFNAAVPREIKFLEDFLRDVKRNAEFPLRRLDEASSTYFPFLHTKTHGAIDWGWEASQLERFICAFDDPYPGAFTFIDDRRVTIKKAAILRRETAFHPFHSGLIVRIDSGRVIVAARGGLLVIREVRDEAGKDARGGLDIGRRFHTPREILDRAMSAHIFYSAEGVKK